MELLLLAKCVKLLRGVYVLKLLTKTSIEINFDSGLESGQTFIVSTTIANITCSSSTLTGCCKSRDEFNQSKCVIPEYSNYSTVK